MSSSPVVKTIVIGKTGNPGPQGPSGNRGNTGTTGPTGSTGPIGVYYTSSSISQNLLTLTLSDETSITVNAATLRGATYADKTFGLVKGSNTGPSSVIAQFGPLQDVDGGTFDFKGICAYGSLRASLTGPNNEYISIDTIYWGKDLPGNYDPTTIATGRALYLGDPKTVYGAGFTHIAITNENVSKGISGAFNFEITKFGTGVDDTSFSLNAGSRIVSVGPIKRNAISGLTGNIIVGGIGTTKGVFLDTSAAGTFVLKTPIGIQGITGKFNKNEVASITLLVESDNVWRFPANVYFAPDENYLSCGKNIIGLMTYDGGESWLATVSHRGHGVDQVNRQCIPGYLFGSCCYTNSDGTLECLDYTNQTVCDLLFGNFNPGRPCEESCVSDVGICCGGNGNCIEGVSVTLCDKFGGQYWPGVTCVDYKGSLNHPIGNLTQEEIKDQGRFCYNPCDANDVSVCCRDGQCLGNYTRAQCELILGGKSLTAGSCEDADCCDYTTIGGACCKCNVDADGLPTSYDCLPDLLPSECRAAGGFYMGPGKQCNEVSCGCVCRSGSGSCVPRNCPTGQIWSQAECSCVPDQTPAGPGICCKNGICSATATSKPDCDAECGHWLTEYDIDVINPLTGTRKYEIDPETDCVLCAGVRPIVEIIDPGSCTPAINIAKNDMSNPATCCRPTIADAIVSAGAGCYDLFLNRIGIPIPLSSSYPALSTYENIRDAILELHKCPLTQNAANVINKQGFLLFQKLRDEGALEIAGQCPEECCVCDQNGSLVCEPKFSGVGTAEEFFTVLCNESNGCPPGTVVNDGVGTPPTCQVGPSPGQTLPGGGNGEGNIPESPSECITGYCENPYIGCECPANELRSLAVRNVKVYINSTDYSCVPVACGDCVGYEFCEVT